MEILAADWLLIKIGVSVVRHAAPWWKPQNRLDWGTKQRHLAGRDTPLWECRL